MTGRKKLYSFAALLSILLIIPFVFGLGIVDVSRFLLGSPSAADGAPASSTASVFLDPAVIIDANLQSGFFWVNVNISSITDLYTWHVKLSWDTNILNVSNLVYDDFLAAGTVSPNGTSSGVANITGVFHADGDAWIAESVLGDYTGVDGNGTLCAVEFEVVGYGSTGITISRSETMPTTLLDSAGGSLLFTEAAGYFSNKYLGDFDADWDCDFPDFMVFASAYLKTSGQPGYDIEADFDLDGDVDFPDFMAFSTNYLKTFP